MDIKERMQTTIVLVTHDAAVASYCDTVVFIENGRVCDTLRKEGAAQPFFHNNRHPHTAMYPHIFSVFLFHSVFAKSVAGLYSLSIYKYAIPYNDQKPV